MFGIGFWELVLILVIALVALGPEKLPGFAKSLGKGMRELRDAANGVRRAIEDETEDLTSELDDLRQTSARKDKNAKDSGIREDRDETHENSEEEKEKGKGH
ncbi:MAG: twin-arginine translocase subunit TatB [Deltaproteobacteria bacterium]|nr:twin-arginine translocase subunit TatB [Deltaproteobacteria bacterium]